MSVALSSLGCEMVTKRRGKQLEIMPVKMEPEQKGPIVEIQFRGNFYGYMSYSSTRQRNKGRRSLAVRMKRIR